MRDRRQRSLRHRRAGATIARVRRLICDIQRNFRLRRKLAVRRRGLDRRRVDPADIWFEEQLSCAEDYDFLIRFCAKYRSDFTQMKRYVGEYLIKDDGSNKTYGRPVGVAIDRAGALLVADDAGNAVWRVTSEPEQSRTR